MIKDPFCGGPVNSWIKEKEFLSMLEKMKKQK